MDKKQLIQEFNEGKRKGKFACPITHSMGVVVVDIIHGIEDKVFGYATPDGGKTKDFFLVKLKGKSFKFRSVNFNLSTEFVRI